MDNVTSLDAHRAKKTYPQHRVAVMTDDQIRHANQEKQAKRHKTEVGNLLKGLARSAKSGLDALHENSSEPREVLRDLQVQQVTDILMANSPDFTSKFTTEELNSLIREVIV